MSNLLSVTNLRIETTPKHKSEKPKVLVDGVSFTLEKGKVLGLIGESGAGKSTIGLAAMSYARPGCALTGGEIVVNNREVRLAGAKEIIKLRGAEVAYVAQSAAAAFNPSHRLIDQIVESSVRHGTSSRKEAESFAVDLFDQLGLPNPKTFGQRFPHQVSGGQLQRAMTAMALCTKPDLIVFDEPTTALDVTTQIDVLAAIKKAINNTGTAALYITHDLAVVAQISDDIMVLRHGKMVEYDSADNILNNPQEDYTQRLVSVRSIVVEEKADGDKPIVELKNIDAAYGRSTVKILKNVSMSVDAGQTLAIVGESGSGKSTAARVITGLLPPMSGEVLYNGVALPKATNKRSREQLRTLQMISQLPDVALNPRQRISSILGRPLQFYFSMNKSDRRKRVIELLEAVELDESYLDRLPGQLSGGQKQRICIARALAADPDVIICDEVTSALDPLVADDILKLLLKLQQDTDVAYIFITHDIATVRAIADKVVVMYQGEVIENGSKSEVLSPPHKDYTHLLLSSVPEMRIGWLEQVLEERRMGSADN